jgi:NitT/TauT family transport system substrate-binding protein
MKIMQITRRNALFMSSLLALSSAKAQIMDAQLFTLGISENERGFLPLLESIQLFETFKAKGLEIRLERLGEDEILKKLQDNSLDLALFDLSSFIAGFDNTQENTPRAILSLTDYPPHAIIGRKSRGITDEIKSLSEKTIASVVNARAFLRFSLLETPANLKHEAVGAPILQPLLASGETDAILGNAPELLESLKAGGLASDDLSVLPYKDYGLALYGTSLLCASKTRKDREEPLKSLIYTFKTLLLEINATNYINGLRLKSGEKEERIAAQFLHLLKNYIFTPRIKEQGVGRHDISRFKLVLSQLNKLKPLKNAPIPEQIFDESLL